MLLLSVRSDKMVGILDDGATQRRNDEGERPVTNSKGERERKMGREPRKETTGRGETGACGEQGTATLSLVR